MIKQRKSTKNQFGQYFTPDRIANFMIDLANISEDSDVLEPSCGDGVFLRLLQDRGYRHLTAFEIDKTLAKEFTGVRYESFVSADIHQQFDLIIGNPPYIRWKNLEPELKQELQVSTLWNQYCNSLCDYLYIFILKSIEILKDGGQLIFICPEYWMNTTHSEPLRDYMVQHGFFEKIYHFNETPIFDKVAASIVIFKFIKSKKTSQKIDLIKFQSSQKLTDDVLERLFKQESLQNVEYLQIPQFQTGERWLLHSEIRVAESKKLEMECAQGSVANITLPLWNYAHSYPTIGDICDIGNGLVSGLDKAFQVNGHTLNEQEKKATLPVVKAKNLSSYLTNGVTPYIFIEDGLNEDQFQKKYPNYYEHFQFYKTDLEKRYQYGRKINYWEWVFRRNFDLFSRKEKRIFIPCKERVSHKSYFRFALVEQGIFPTQDVTAIFRKKGTRESIEYILAYLNQPAVFNWLCCNGIVKGNIVEFSEKPIASIPFRHINWNNAKEVQMHELITSLTQELVETRRECLIGRIQELFHSLLQSSVEEKV